VKNLVSLGDPSLVIGSDRLRRLLLSALESFEGVRRVLIVPPDFTRRHSGAGEITGEAYRFFSSFAEVDILPALGRHAPMSREETANLFGPIPKDRFHLHDCRRGTVPVGEIPSGIVKDVTDGLADFPIAVEVNRLLLEGGYDLILSTGQVVPHEVTGMSGHSKNLIVGTGGREVIDKTHFLGALIGIEEVLGRSRSAVRRLLDYAERELLGGLPILHALTVRERTGEGNLVTRGFYVGDGKEVFRKAARLSRQVNVTFLSEPLRKVVVYLDPSRYKSAWVGNKAIYRTRMALAEGGELIVLAPGIGSFGEDPETDGIIRSQGYRGRAATLDAMRAGGRLGNNQAAAGHLIRGSTEGRFSVTYAPGGMSREEIEGVAYRYADLEGMMDRYDPARLSPGRNMLPDGEEIFFVPDPGAGLWSLRSRFQTERER
jgi:nickel-dependent lactate racemase